MLSPLAINAAFVQFSAYRSGQGLVLETLILLKISLAGLAAWMLRLVSVKAIVVKIASSPLRRGGRRRWRRLGVISALWD